MPLPLKKVFMRVNVYALPPVPFPTETDIFVDYHVSTANMLLAKTLLEKQSVIYV